MAGVGTNKIFENEQTTIWELFLAPGEGHGLHTHRRTYAFYVMQGSELRVLDADGKEVATVETHAGEFFTFRKEGDELVSGAESDTLRIPATHSVENIGDAHYKEILVEFK